MTIAITSLGEIIDWLLKNRKLFGWDLGVMEVAAKYKLAYPTLQFKVKADMDEIISTNNELFDIIY